MHYCYYTLISVLLMYYHVHTLSITDNCPLGDRKGSIFSNSDLTCDTVVASDCYDTTVEAECCETCPSLQRPELGASCLYGDISGLIFTNSELTCATATASYCYDSTVEEKCCEKCPTLQNAAFGSDCLYGDKHSAW